MYGKMRLCVLKGMVLKLTLLSSVEHKRRYFEECWCFFTYYGSQWLPSTVGLTTCTQVWNNLWVWILIIAKVFSPLTNGLILQNVKWKFTFSVGVYIHQPYISTVCNALVSLFLHDYSVRYHSLNPNYIHERLKQLGQSFTLRVLLVQVDVVSLCLSHSLITSHLFDFPILHPFTNVYDYLNLYKLNDK